MNTDHLIADLATIRENKLSLVERLADDLAHEIKNPLHSMVINLEVLRRRLIRLGSDSQDDLLRYTTVLGSELERVNRRVDLLLRMVRPYRESDEPTSLGEVLEELRELVGLECERHSVRLELEPLENDVGARLPRSAARQMVLSLMLTLLDGLPAGGTLAVTSGIDSAHLRLCFEGRTGSSGPAPTHAAELSSYLPVARTLAESLGGSLEVHPREAARGLAPPGGGTDRYVLCLPRER